MPQQATLPVIFRATRSGPERGEVTAVFPTCPADYAGRQFTVYAHLGQHGGATFTWYWSTRAAKPHEYASLLAELRGIYGSSIGPGDPIIQLKVYQRMTPVHRREFEREVQRNLRQLRADPSGGPWSPDAAQAAGAAMVERGI